MLATLSVLATLAGLALGALAAAALGGIANFLSSSSLTLGSLVATVVAAAGAKAESGDSKRNDKLLHC